MTQDKIIVRGAREHNLKNINVDIPRPRRRGSAELAALEGSILKKLLEGAEDSSDL